MATGTRHSEAARHAGWLLLAKPPTLAALLGTLAPFFVGYIVLYDAIAYWFLKASLGAVGILVCGVFALASTYGFFYFRSPSDLHHGQY